MKKTLFLSYFIITSTILFAQKNSVSGTIVDSTNAPLVYATIAVLQPDSVVEAFTLSDDLGAFKFGGLKPQKYLLQVSYTGYESRFMAFEVTEKNNGIDLGKIKLKQRQYELTEVTVNADYIPIQIKGDTIQYNADAFKTQPNATVEDLIKQLPGMEVGEDGEIKAQGESVQRIMINGKDFFGGKDIKKATKNLPADAVNSVQVFDKKSDNAEFTGIDDGNEEKAINLELKEDKTKGLFGNVTVGGGNNNRFESKVTLNQFNKKRQITIIGQGNNINEQGFSFSDFSSIQNGGMSNVFGSSGLRGSSLNWGNGLASGDTRIFGGGIDFKTDLNDKTDLYIDFFNSYLNKSQISSTKQEFFLEENSYKTDETSIDFSDNLQQSINVKSKTKIDSTQEVTLSSTFQKGTLYNTNRQIGESRDVNDSLQNASSSNTFNNTANTKMEASVYYRKKFKKKGRNTSLNVTGSSDNSASDALLFSTLQNFSDSSSTIDSTNQKQTSSISNQELNLYASFTEPIAKKSFVSASMTYFNRLGDNNKEFKDVFANSEKTNDDLSTEYQNSYIYYKPNLNYKYNSQRLTINSGVGFQQSELRGTFSDTSFVIEKSALDILPLATISYQLAKRSKLKLFYTTSVSVPSMSQLQPIVNNSNPLYIYVGNPDLQRQYLKTIRLNYNYYSEFSETSIYTYAATTFTQNNIVNSITTTNGFAQRVTPINLGTQNYSWAYFYFGRPIKPIGIKINTWINGSKTNNKSLVNAIENKTTTETATLNAGIGNYKQEKVSLYTSFKPSITSTDYSINTEQNRTYFIYKYTANITITAIKKWTFSTNLNYDIYTKEAFGKETKIPILTASISRTFLKNDRGELKVRVFDALDKNQGVTRDNGANYISETVTNSLGRTFMLSFSYNLSKLGNTEKKGGFMHF